MVVVFRWIILVLAVTLGGGAVAEAKPRPQKPSLTILISLDGFRPDYLDRGNTPALNALAADGARGAMQPSFPSLTYPN
ncbi:MAG: alkaline phosphatase family protein, partial [Caulobacter sp.]|nr:alkaline phosphatase family protein [Caulobacter sp.]